MSALNFDLKLAKDCADAFSNATGLGCMVSNGAGKIYFETGYSCEKCKMCERCGQDRVKCNSAHNYGMTSAERFGGKYIYFCPLGLTCFVSPIIGEEGAAAKITVGPFLMMDLQDYIENDLYAKLPLTNEQIESAKEELNNVPCAPPDKVNSLSTLLFMAAGFMNNVWAANNMISNMAKTELQGQITSYIAALKSDEPEPPYPFEVERALLRAITAADKPTAQKSLNELFGYIFFMCKGSFETSKTRVYELLVMMSRAAVDAGANPEKTLSLSHEYLHALIALSTTDELCYWLTEVMSRFINDVFDYRDSKHSDIIYKALNYMRANYAKKIMIEDVANAVYLSPDYFSRIFKRETQRTFTMYLNEIRIEKSKELLLHEQIRLTDISIMTGFEDQSYFTKVFKKLTGMSPLKYRQTKAGAKKAAK